MQDMPEISSSCSIKSAQNSATIAITLPVQHSGNNNRSLSTEGDPTEDRSALHTARAAAEHLLDAFYCVEAENKAILASDSGRYHEQDVDDLLSGAGFPPQTEVTCHPTARPSSSATPGQSLREPLAISNAQLAEPIYLTGNAVSGALLKLEYRGMVIPLEGSYSDVIDPIAFIPDAFWQKQSRLTRDERIIILKTYAEQRKKHGIIKRIHAN